MKLLNLIFCSFILIFYNTPRLLAHNTDEKVSLNNSSDINNEIALLTNKVCDLLAQGYSPEKVISLLSKDVKDSYNIQKLAKHAQELVGEPAKNNAVNIVIISSDKKAEESDKRKSFWSTKNRRLFLKVAVIILLAATIWYLLSHIKLPLPGKSGFIPGSPSLENNGNGQSNQRLGASELPPSNAAPQARGSSVSQPNESPAAQPNGIAESGQRTAREPVHQVHSSQVRLAQVQVATVPQPNQNGFVSTDRETAHTNYEILGQLREAIRTTAS